MRIESYTIDNYTVLTLWADDEVICQTEMLTADWLQANRLNGIPE